MVHTIQLPLRPSVAGALRRSQFGCLGSTSSGKVRTLMTLVAAIISGYQTFRNQLNRYRHPICWIIRRYLGFTLVLMRAYRYTLCVFATESLVGASDRISRRNDVPFQYRMLGQVGIVHHYRSFSRCRVTLEANFEFRRMLPCFHLHVVHLLYPGDVLSATFPRTNCVWLQDLILSFHGHTSMCSMSYSHTAECLLISLLSV